MDKNSNTQLVYSTQAGRVRTAPAPALSPTPPSDGILRIGILKHGRGGKPVTVLTGIPLQGDDLENYARATKQKCGCGGTLRDGTLEIQGDKRDLILADALARGWKAKKAGG